MKKKVIINYYLTYKCNLCCPYCYVYNNSNTNNTQRNKQIISRLNKLLAYQQYEVIVEFFGGEPLLEHDFILLALNQIQASKFYLTTNGLLYFSNSLFNLLDSIYISVHLFNGANLELYLNKINELKPYFYKIKFIFVLDKYNLDLYYQFINVIASLGYKNTIFILPVFFKYNWNKEDLRKIYNFCVYLLKKSFNLDYLYYRFDKIDIEFSLDYKGNIYGFNGEFIYSQNLRKQFYIGKITDLPEILWEKIINFHNTYNHLSLDEYASIRYSSGLSIQQSYDNFISLNKYLIFLEKFL